MSLKVLYPWECDETVSNVKSLHIQGRRTLKFLGTGFGLWGFIAYIIFHHPSQSWSYYDPIRDSWQEGHTQQEARGLVDALMVEEGWYLL